MRLSLRTVLVTPFVVIVTATVALTSWLAFNSGQRAVHQVAQQLRNEITARVEDHLHYFVTGVSRLNPSHIEAFNLDQAVPQEEDNFKRYFLRQLRSFPNIHMSYVAKSAGGEFYGAQRLGNQGLQIVIANAATGGKLNRYRPTPEGEWVLSDSAPSPDFRQRPWYTRAAEQARAVWSEVYPSFTDGTLLLTSALPLYTRHGELWGVLGSDITLERLSGFLRQLQVARSGRVFILERSGLLVASSSPLPPFGADYQRLSLAEFDEPLARAVAPHLPAHLARLQQQGTVQSFRFAFKDDRVFVDLTPWRDEGGLEWVIAVLVPESDFMAEIRANTNSSVVLVLAVLLLLTLLSLFAGRWLVRPLQELSYAATRLAAGEWEQHLPPQRGDELGQLAGAFRDMTAHLREAFGALEQLNAELEQRVLDRTRKLQEAYEKLKESQFQLIQSEKMASLGQMVAGIAHEINTPLGYVKSNVDLGRQLLAQLEQILQEQTALLTELTQLPPQAEESLRRRLAEASADLAKFQADSPLPDTLEICVDALHGLDRIAELVLDLKNFSRLDRAPVENIDLHQCIDDALMIAHHEVKHKARVVKHYGLIPRVTVSPSQLNQVVLNLVLNAAQAIEDSGTIEITTHADADSVYLAVRDTGQGIAADKLEHIFEPFFTTKPMSQGSGMGLFITHQIIQRHGGEIRVESEVGRGTCFHLSLPRRPRLAEDATPPDLHRPDTGS